MKTKHTHPLEPANSWEVSYILALHRPKIDIAAKLSDIFFTIGSDRAKELTIWAKNHFDSQWVKNHTLPKKGK